MVALALEVEECDCPLVPEGQDCTFHEMRMALGEGTDAQRIYWAEEGRGEDARPKLMAKAKGDGTPQLKPQNLPPEHQLLGVIVGAQACIHTHRPHRLALGDWIALLRLWDAVGYADRPLGQPRKVATRKGRLALYRLRASRGEALFHPADLCLAEEEGVEMMARKGKTETGKEGMVQR